MSRFFGQAIATQLGSQKRWDPRSGWDIRIPYVGPPGTIDVLEQTLVNAGVRIADRRPLHEGGYNILTAQYGADVSQDPAKPLADLWNLLGNDLEKSLWECPALKLIFNNTDWFSSDGVPTPEYIAIRRDIMDLATGAKLISELGSSDPTVGSWWTDTDGLKPLLRKFAGALCRGVDAFFVSQWVIRRQMIINKGSTIRLAENVGLHGLPNTRNIDKVFPSASDLAESEGLPGGLPFDIPEGAWLKKTPSCEQTAADKFTITQEYWHSASYEPIAYDAASI